MTLANVCTTAIALVCMVSPLVAQQDEWRHPCPAAVDTSSAALTPAAEPRFEAADPARPSYFRRILQVQLDDSVGPSGLCRILQEARATALSAWQPRRAVNVLIRLNDMPGSIDELEARRASVESIVGVERVSRTMVPRMFWP